MSITTRNERLPVADVADETGETRVAPVGRALTPLPAEFPFLRPPRGPDEIGRLGGYRVLKLLGAGGMGKVFLAEDVGLQRHVALKVMCPPRGEDALGYRERFLREARAQAAIRHPNLVAVYQVGEDRGTVFLAMELLEGETLDARIRREAPLDVADVLRIAGDIADGLAAIHARGLIHRDIKPGNIWLADVPNAVGVPADQTDPLCFTEPTAEPEPAAPAQPPAKILDFGLVREVACDTRLTEVGAVVGTPAFMSPEQARGRPLDHRTDLFSFGCAVYAMATGRPPFEADTPMALAAALAADEPVPARRLNPDVPRALSDLIAALLSKEADGRPASADEVAARLRAVRVGAEDDEDEAPRPVSARRRDGGGLWRRYAVAGVAVVVGLALAVAAVVSLTHTPAASAPPASPPAVVEKDKGAKPPAKPAKSPEPTVEYLSDLPSIRAVTYPPPGRPLPPGTEGAPLVGTIRMPHALHMHPAPPKTVPAQLSFVLNGAYSRFNAEVGFNDSADRTSSLLVGFVVVADNRPIWQSRPLTVGQTERCDVDLRGVNTLLLSTVTLGAQHHGAHAVWIDPRITK